MKRALLLLAVAYAVVLTGEEEPRVYVDFQEIMIPMRDGVRLQTVILTPRNPKGPLPFLIDRTPYGVPEREQVASGFPSAQRWRSEKYISVFQNIRGRFRSEGKFAMFCPPHDAAASTDETTDAWDTVDWLVKNVPNNNGRAGMAGTSYDGWTAVMSALDPHPALKAVIEQASPADQFLGDDFHHNGAFRLSYGFEYAALLETTATDNYHFEFDKHDTFDWYLGLGVLSNAEEKYFHGKMPTWRDFTRHPNYDEFWQRQAFARYLGGVKLPIVHVAGWWDQEDFYGPQEIYRLMERHDPEHWNYFVAGPWFHGGWQLDGSQIGPIEFGSDTAQYYREKVYEPWFDHWLRGAEQKPLAEATVFETGANQWREYAAWPPKEHVESRRLYLREDRRLSADDPGRDGSFDRFVSDPANPVPYRPRPIPPTYPGPEWRVWLVQDQRFLQNRGDVLRWQTEPLTVDVRVAGEIQAELLASTSGTDSDWVVKLIDVYPEDEKKLPGYQLMVASEILRARFRNSYSKPEPLPAGKAVNYAIGLHTNAHAFLKGHRIMVQVQSSWFPLYDRNPQRYVPNIFEAHARDYVKATQKIYRGSAIVLPVLR